MNPFPNPFTAYLFVYFTGNAKQDEAIHFALSNDGYEFKALHANRPVIDSQLISTTGGVRDPHLVRGVNDNIFYMVATDMVSDNGWESNRAMILLKSKDLIKWTSAVVNLQTRFPGNEKLLRVWAPQTIFDKVAAKHMVYWSMKHGSDPDKIYYAYVNADFTDLESEPQQLFFHPHNHACIDADIISVNEKFYLFFKIHEAVTGIKMAVSEKLTEGYVMGEQFIQQTMEPVEGSCVFPLNNGNGYMLMYDLYMSGQYQFLLTKDFRDFTIVDDMMKLDFHPRHGCIVPITELEADRLVKQWG